jgi:hypothetical protein
MSTEEYEDYCELKVVQAINNDQDLRSCDCVVMKPSKNNSILQFRRGNCKDVSVQIF